MGEIRSQRGNSVQAFLKPHLRIIGSQCHANLFAAHGGRVTLAAVSPIYFHVVGPGFDSEMLPECKTQSWTRTHIQPRPTANSGVRAICTDDPSRANSA